MTYVLYLMLLLITGCFTAPMDEPVRIDLPVYNQPQTVSNVQLTKPIELETYPGVDARSDKSIVGNLISHKIQAATNVLGNKLASTSVTAASGNIIDLFAPPVTTLEGALLEMEDLGSKKLSVKENLHNIVAGIFQPKPIVDTIKEEEKFGNSGDKFYSAGRAIVGGAEGISNLVNSVLEVPGNIFRKITRAASEKLSNLGGRLIGL